MSQTNRKQERDYSAEVKVLQPEVEAIAKVSYLICCVSKS
jgi:hypothetical protein